MNMPILAYSGAVLKIIPAAAHTDLYDRLDIISFEKISAFYTRYLK